MLRYIDSTLILPKQSYKMINNFNKNQPLIVYDLFAGAGGFGLGFELSNEFKVKLSLEKDLWAVETLKENSRSGENKIVHQDIREFQTRKSISDLGIEKPSIIIGGPPCQGFSLQGPLKDPNDPRNSLFKDFARWVEFLKPSVFVMENVTGLLHRYNAEGKKVIDIIKATFEEIGYHVEIWNLNAANYGVPQLRNRVFIVGNSIIKDDIKPPAITHYIKSLSNNLIFDDLIPAVTIEEAICDLPYIEAWQGDEKMEYESEPTSLFQKWARRDSYFVHNHVAMNHTKRLIERYKLIQKGVKINDVPDNLRVKKRSGNGVLSDVTFSSNYRHLKKDAISLTIPASFYSTFIHPTIPRNITSREAARIQSFPDWYVFKGKRTVMSSKLLKKMGKDSEDYLSQYNQIGNAVPPLLAKAIAEKISTFLKMTKKETPKKQVLEHV